MQIPLKIIFILSGLMFLGGWIAVLVRSYCLGLTLIISPVVAVGLAFWAAMYSDPPGLLPFWAWLVGMTISLAVMLRWKSRKQKSGLEEQSEVDGWGSRQDRC